MPGEVTKSGPGKETGERGDVTVQIQENGQKKALLIKIKKSHLLDQKNII